MPKGVGRKIVPAMTPEGREQQLINLAMDRAEEMLLAGTASSQIITHFLKLGTIRAQAELEEIRNKNALLTAKTSQIESSQKIEELVSEAITAFRGYSGEETIEEQDAYEYY